jgi:hypothetical protein
MIPPPSKLTTGPFLKKKINSLKAVVRHEKKTDIFRMFHQRNNRLHYKSRVAQIFSETWF